MRRSAIPAAIATVALGIPMVLLDAAPAQAAAVFVETNPSTVAAGDQLGVRASCDDNLKPATVTSDAFGKVPVEPSFGFLTATVRVPANTRPNDFRVRLSCPDGATAANTLHVVARVRPSRGPATGGGGTATGQAAPLLIGAGLAAMAGGLALAVLAVRRRRFG
jgi:hypothetical protein